VVTELHDALELYGSLEGKFDAEDLEGALTEVSEELKKLPEAHDQLWDCFKTVANKRDEEAFELALEKKDDRDEFYALLSKFSRILKLALSTLQWIDATPKEKVETYKRDVAFFQNLRASVKLRYAEEIDYRDYEKQIQKMLNTYVQADEIVQIVEPVNIFDREEFEAQVDQATSPRAKADTIANRTKRTITEKMEEDPFFYRKFSALLQQAIDDYHAQRISEAEYLAKVREIMEQVRDGKMKEAPDLLKERDLSRALFGALQRELNGPGASSCQSAVVREDPVEYKSSRSSSAASLEAILAQAACSMENIIRKHAVVHWRVNTDAQNRMRNDLDDFLFSLQAQKGISISFDQMDGIIEAAISIALHRTGDV
jgi:type I restriction enzyme R subunit